MKNILRKALVFATNKHNGRLYNGKPYISHPILTAQLLEITAPNDKNLIAAGYLHDLLEDTDTTYEELKELFNEDIANLVKEVTKTEYNTFPNLQTRRGVILKFADRLANLSNMDAWDEGKQKKYLEKSKFWKP